MIIAGTILIIAGIILAILGLIFKLISRKPYSQSVLGIITDSCINAYDFNNGGTGKKYVGIGNSSGGSARYPIFEYKIGGVVYKRAHNVAYNAASVYRMINHSKTVYYNSENPQYASLSKYDTKHILGFVFTIIGIVCIILGVVFILIAVAM